jgi:Fur-regulated basic protein A
MKNIDLIKGVVRVRNTMEQRREKLINKLIAFGIFKKEDRQLFELTLSELEYTYRRIKSQYHPHGEFGSIQWT